MSEIESLTLANHAETHNGLLYLMGGGWTTVNQVVPAGTTSAPPFHFGVGLTMLVPWTETNKKHHVSLYLEREDGGDPLMRIEADFETGRPAGSVEGVDQRVVVAMAAEVTFPGPGGYRAVAELAKQKKCASFRVLHHAGPPMLKSA